MNGEQATDSRLSRPDETLDKWMALLLRSGVIVAALFVAMGGALYLAHHPSPSIDYSRFQGEPAEYRTIGGIVHEARALQGRGLIQLGLLILIATPIARVAFSVFAFAYERDWKYVAFTLIVLGLLIFSLIGNHG